MTSNKYPLVAELVVNSDGEVTLEKADLDGPGSHYLFLTYLFENICYKHFATIKCIRLDRKPGDLS